MLHGCSNLQLTKDRATSNWIAFGQSCVCAPCMWWSNLGWFDLFGCVHTSTKRILAVNQFRNVHVIFPIGIWNGHKAFYLLWRASKSSANDLGPLECTSDMSLVCDAFGFAALCSVCGSCQASSPGQIRFSSRAQTGALRPERSAERIEEVLRLC